MKIINGKEILHKQFDASLGKEYVENEFIKYVDEHKKGMGSITETLIHVANLKGATFEGAGTKQDISLARGLLDKAGIKGKK